jgi:hypothetical protein
VVVNRSMSLDGFVAGPGHAMNWIFEFMAPDAFPEIVRPPAPCSSGGEPTRWPRGRGTPTSLAAKNAAGDGPDPFRPHP